VTAYRLALEVTNVSRAVTSAPEASFLADIPSVSHDDAVAVERPLAEKRRHRWHANCPQHEP